MTQPRGTRPGQPGSTGKTGSAGGSRTRAAGPRTAPRRAAAGASGSAAHPKAHGKASQPTASQPRKPQASGSQPRAQRNATAAGPARSAKSPRPPQKRAAPPRRPAGHRPRSVQVGTASPRRRMRMMVVAVLFVFSIFGAQLLRLQGFDASATSQDALSSRMATVAIPAMRGSILDSKGTVLASSIERRTVTVDQTAVVEYKKTVDGVYTRVGVAGAAEDLSPLVGMPVEELTPILTGSARYRVVQKNITPLNWRKIAALGIPGIYSEPTSERNYPTSTAAASLVGFLQSDGSAGSGVEVMMDKALAGKAGKTTYEQALDGRIIPTGHQQTTPAVPGKDVKLTINSDLQWFAQNALAQKVIQTQALSGTVVVQHARTGELLAVASYPTFDPNTPGQSQGNWTNKAFNEVYEPGSTAKVMTSAAALEEGVVTPSTDRRGAEPHLARRRPRVQGQPRPPDRVPHLRRRARAVEQHRDRPGGREDQVLEDPRLLLPVRPGADVRHGLPGRGQGHPQAGQGLGRLPEGDRALRPGPVGQRAAGHRRLPDHRQRRRPGAPADHLGRSATARAPSRRPRRPSRSASSPRRSPGRYAT